MELAKGRILKRNYVIFAAKFKHANYFQFKDFYVRFMTLQSIVFKLFAKIMKQSCVFCCSSCISLEPTSHLKTDISSLPILVNIQRLRENRKWILFVTNGAKWLSVSLRTKWLWNRFLLQVFAPVLSKEFLTFR